MDKCCNETKTYVSKADSLLYHGNLSQETVQKMKEIRAKFVRLARDIELLGYSRETSTCFTHIETAQMYAIKHLCMVDPQAVREPCEDYAQEFMDSLESQEGCCSSKVVGTIGHCGTVARNELDGSAA
jgi:hypothetical protein